MRTLDLFSGCGGAATGFAQLGDTTTGVELWADAAATHTAAGHETLTNDVRTLDPADFGRVDHFHASLGNGGNGVSDQPPIDVTHWWDADGMHEGPLPPLSEAGPILGVAYSGDIQDDPGWPAFQQWMQQTYTNMQKENDK